MRNPIAGQATVSVKDPEVQRMASFILTQQMQKFEDNAEELTAEDLEKLIHQLPPEERENARAHPEQFARTPVKDLFKIIDFLQDLTLALTEVADIIGLTQLAKLCAKHRDLGFEDFCKQVSQQHNNRLEWAADKLIEFAEQYGNDTESCNESGSTH